MGIHRQFPGIELVLKSPHSGETAQGVITIIRNKVRKHNAKYRNDPDYVLRMPCAYAIGKKFIAMAKADYPSIGEILGVYYTTRGSITREGLVKKNIFTRCSIP